MKTYHTQPHELTDDIPDADLAQAEALAWSYLGMSPGEPGHTLTPMLKERFVCVFHLQVEGDPEGAWIIGGEVPYLLFSDAELKSPMDAVALYAWFFFLWEKHEGVGSEENSLPDYRVPPDWEEFAFADLYKTRFKEMAIFMGTVLVRMNPDEVCHPEIRARCIRAGFIRE